jgi:hypothetical protein
MMRFISKNRERQPSAFKQIREKQQQMSFPRVNRDPQLL